MNKKVPIHKFLLKALPLTAILGGGAYYLTDRYSIGVDPQEKTCLQWRVFVIDKYEREIVRGEIYAFRSESMDPYFKDGSQVIKVADGIPGDRVKVTTEKTFVNDKVVGEGLLLNKKLKKPKSRFVREEVVPQDKFWFMGRSLDSFDSRYWGYVSKSNIVGRAYPIW